MLVDHRGVDVRNLDETLPPGLAANAVGMLAITLGAELPALVGPVLVDADGHRHHGFVPQGLPVLAAPASSLGAMRTEAIAADVGVVGFPAAGQQTTDYDAFCPSCADRGQARNLRA